MKSDGTGATPADNKEHLQINTAVATRKHSRPDIAMVLFIGLQGLDLLTTLLVFKHGGVELNPVVGILMTGVGRKTAVLLSKATLVAVIWSFRSRRRVLLFGDALYTGIVIWNLMILAAFQ
jgi:hypothetical protein